MEIELRQGSALLSGPPDSCRGFVRLHNPTAYAVRVRSLTLQQSAAADGSARELKQVGLRLPGPSGALTARVRARLEAGEGEEVEVSLSLDSATPPGRYAGVLASAAGERPVDIEVLEQRQGRTTPALAVASAAPGKTCEVALWLRNSGNVEFTVPTTLGLLLRPVGRDWQHQFHAAARAHGHNGYEALLDDFATRMGEEEPPAARAVVLDGAGPLEPGLSRGARLRLTVPEGLGKGRTWRLEGALGHALFHMRLYS